MRRSDRQSVSIPCPRGHGEGRTGMACKLGSQGQDSHVCGARWRSSRKTERSVPG